MLNLCRMMVVDKFEDENFSAKLGQDCSPRVSRWRRKIGRNCINILLIITTSILHLQLLVVLA
ncbi:unnamed protein product [Arabidopsis halleri]